MKPYGIPRLGTDRQEAPDVQDAHDLGAPSRVHPQRARKRRAARRRWKRAHRARIRRALAEYCR
jgi:hypothetical protein